jgi:hypothetical protein
MLVFVVRVTMIDYIFIQTNKMMPKRHEFICTSKTFFATSTRIGHPNFDIKEGTIHSNIPHFLKYYYVVEIHIDFMLVKMKGSINKEMAKKMKRRESLES